MAQIDPLPTAHNFSGASIIFKTIIIHTATYLLMGLFALYTFNYAETFSTGIMSELMRPTTDTIVMFGPLFQPIRGILFGIVFYLLRDILFTQKNGWLIIWVMLSFIGILSTFGPTPGSIEGAIYTRFSYTSLYDISLIEVYGQALALSIGVFYWVRNPHNRWLTWVFSIIAALAILFPLAGYFLAPLAAQ